MSQLSLDLNYSDSIRNRLLSERDLIWYSNIQSHFSYLVKERPDGFTDLWIANEKFGVHYVGRT